MVTGLALAGCGGGAGVDRAPGPPRCETITRAEHPADTVTVVLFDKVDLSHAPWGRNREERFVFSHLYETLVAIDCHGVARTTALTESVIEASDGWLIELKEDARFWDDTPVTAKDVKTCLDTAIESDIAIKSVDVIDERSLIVHGNIMLLALPMLSITKEPYSSGQRIGTGDWVIEATDNEILMQPATGETPTVRFVRRNAGSELDITDSTVDALITDDPAAIDYARSKDDAVFATLAWDKAYLLLSRSRVEQLKNVAIVPNLPASLCDDLATNAVAADARGGSSIVLEGERALRGDMAITGYLPASVHTPTRRILFPSDDRTAEALAQRIVALAAMDTATSAQARAVVRAVPGAGPNLRAVGVARTVLVTESSRSDADADYVMPLSWDSDFPFVELCLARRAPFLFSAWPVSRAVLPLVETRSHFIAISDRIGFVDDHAGNVQIMIQTSERKR